MDRYKERTHMENLHLKNLIQKPNPLIILKKLKDIEHAHKNNLPADIIIEININGRFKNYLKRRQNGKFIFKKLKRSRYKTF